MAKDLLIAWLNDAYAMEQALIPVLQNHTKDTENEMPEAAGRLRRHIQETELHLQRIEECLTLLGSTRSTAKAAMGSVLGTAQSVMTGMFSDEMIKNVLADYGAEQFEVAAYTALVAAADELGEDEIARLCEENLREDQLMAAWLEQQIPTVVAQMIAKTSTSTRR